MPRQATTTRKPTSEPQLPGGGAPTWEVAFLFPAQGTWTEEDFWDLTAFHQSSPRIELSNGCLEVLPVPTQLHQFILFFLAKLLDAFADAHAPGAVLTSGTNIRLKKGKIRNPDVVYMRAENKHRRHEEYWDGADLVIEVVSQDPKDRKRDWEIKPKEYAEAGIPEYWIVDPQEQVIRVLSLRGKKYRIHGDFGPGEEATSVLLPGFAVSVDEALAPPGSEPSA